MVALGAIVVFAGMQLVDVDEYASSTASGVSASSTRCS
jgi:hypothetical protein